MVQITNTYSYNGGVQSSNTMYYKGSAEAYIKSLQKMLPVKGYNLFEVSRIMSGYYIIHVIKIDPELEYVITIMEV